MFSGISKSLDFLWFLNMLRCSVLVSVQKGQLGHGDKVQRDRPTIVSELSKYVTLFYLIVRVIG